MKISECKYGEVVFHEVDPLTPGHIKGFIFEDDVFKVKVEWPCGLVGKEFISELEVWRNED